MFEGLLLGLRYSKITSMSSVSVRFVRFWERSRVCGTLLRVGY